jgi:hypothetical protein
MKNNRKARIKSNPYWNEVRIQRLMKRASIVTKMYRLCLDRQDKGLR